MNDAGTPPWEEVTEEYTRRLVAISSVSPGPGEIEAAKEALAIMREDGLEHEYQESGLEALIGDPHGRSIAYALVRGSTPRTFVVLGHLDTVATDRDEPGLDEGIEDGDDDGPGLARRDEL